MLPFPCAQGLHPPLAHRAHIPPCQPRSLQEGPLEKACAMGQLWAALLQPDGTELFLGRGVWSKGSEGGDGGGPGGPPAGGRRLGGKGKARRGNAAISWSHLPGSAPPGMVPSPPGDPAPQLWALEVCVQTLGSPSGGSIICAAPVAASRVPCRCRAGFPLSGCPSVTSIPSASQGSSPGFAPSLASLARKRPRRAFPALGKKS